MIGGGVGAIIGGTTGAKKGKEKIKNIDLKICVRDTKNPIYRINFYKENYGDAEKWHGIISVLMKQASNSDKSTENRKSISTSDELIKLKSLLDAGVLTVEEFNIQKRKVLK